MTIAPRDAGTSTPSHGAVERGHDAPVAVPSVWAVVSAYLHSGTAASEAAPETIRGSAPERVAQVRGLFEQAHTPAPKPVLQRGSTRDALRSLFTRVEGLDPTPLPASDGVDGTEVIDLRDHWAADGRSHRELRDVHDHGEVRDQREQAEIDLRDGSQDGPVRRVQQYATMRPDTVDDAVVRWYTMRHRQHSHSGR